MSSYTETLAQIDQMQERIKAFGDFPVEIKKKLQYKFRLDWNYYSNSMEGNTLTKAETRDVMVGVLNVAGKPLKDVLERLLADPSKISNDMVEGTLRFKRLEGVPEALSAIRDSIVDDNGQRQSILGTLSDFNGPIALIWGEKDQIVPLPDQSKLPSNAKLSVISSVGHMPQMEGASEVNSLVLENIGRV